MAYIYMEYYSVIKKMEILPFATTWMDLAGIMLTELHQTGKDKIPYDFTNIWKPKSTTKQKWLQRTNRWLPEWVARKKQVREVKRHKLPTAK